MRISRFGPVTHRLGRLTIVPLAVAGCRTLRTAPDANGKRLSRDQLATGPADQVLGGDGFWRGCAALPVCPADSAAFVTGSAPPRFVWTGR